MVNWLRLEGIVDKVVGNAFAEPVRISFMKNGAVDPDRPAVDVMAQMHVGSDDSNGVDGSNSQGGFRTRLVGGQAELFLERARYMGPMPRQGDQVRATGRTGQPWFGVSNVADHDTSLIVVSLNRG